jgi:hypothetical protein
VNKLTAKQKLEMRRERAAATTIPWGDHSLNGKERRTRPFYVRGGTFPKGAVALLANAK